MAESGIGEYFGDDMEIDSGGAEGVFGSSLYAIYVRADNPSQLRSAYRNYFNDPSDFSEIVRHESDVV